MKCHLTDTMSAIFFSKQLGKHIIDLHFARIVRQCPHLVKHWKAGLCIHHRLCKEAQAAHGSHTNPYKPRATRVSSGFIFEGTFGVPSHCPGAANAVDALSSWHSMTSTLFVRPPGPPKALLISPQRAQTNFVEHCKASYANAEPLLICALINIARSC